MTPKSMGTPPILHAARVALLGVSFGVPAAVLGQSQAPFDPARLMADVQAYYDMGVHRTGHPGDLATSAWLDARLRAAGLETSTHDFSVNQFFLDEAWIDDGRGEIDAFPIWLPRATGSSGLSGRLVLVGEATPASDIRGAVAWLDPGATAAQRRALDAKAVAAGAAAIVFETSDGAGTGVLSAVNAERRYVDAQRPVPTLIFGAASSSRLRQAIGGTVTVKLVGRFDENTRASNVIGTRVVDADADWIVISTPSSGWFTNAGERGGGIALLLALAEWIGDRENGLNYLLVATSGHELDYLGARLFHEAHLAPPPERTRVWLHLGAQIATPPWRDEAGTLRPGAEVTTGTLQASVELADIIRDAFAGLPMYTLRTDTRIGEFRDLAEHGYRGLGVVGGSNPWFHVPGDDPRGVSAETLALAASAIADALVSVESFQP